MRYVVKVARIPGDMYLATKRMTQVPYCEGINNPEIMIWKTQVAAEKYLEKNFSWQPTYLVDYVIMERE